MTDIERDIMGYLGKAVADAGIDATLTGDSGLLRAGLLDSMGLVGLIRFLEDHFGLDIPDADLDPALFDTPASIVRYVSGRLAEAAA